MPTRRHLLASAALAAAGSLPHPSDAATPPQIAVMAKQIDDIVSLDPAEAYEPTGTEIGGNLYRRLVLPDPAKAMAIAGDLAQSWEISDGGCTLTFHLDASARFASGAPVTPEDVAFSFQRAVQMNKAPAFILSQFGFTKDKVAEQVVASDAKTVVLRLPAPTAPSLLLNCLSANVASIVERALVLQHATNGDFGNSWMKSASAGGGLYKLVTWAPDEHIILDANPYGAATSKVRRIVIQSVKDPATQMLLLQRGDADIARDLTPDQLRSVAADSNLHTVSAQQATLMYIAMNEAVAAFQKPAVRQAVKWAIDYDAIAKDITPGLWNACQSFVPRGLPGALEKNSFSHDPSRARKLLADAGLPEGFSVTMDYIADSPYSDIAQSIQENLAAIGIRVQLLPGEQKQVITKTRSRSHQMAMLNWGSDYFDPNSNAQGFCANPDDSAASKLQSAAWRSHFVDPALTQDVVRAVSIQNTDQRIALYRQMQREFQDQSPFAFILQKTETAAMRRRVTGLQLMPMTSFTRYLIRKS